MVFLLGLRNFHGSHFGWHWQLVLRDEEGEGCGVQLELALGSDLWLRHLVLIWINRGDIVHVTALVVYHRIELNIYGAVDVAVYLTIIVHDLGCICDGERSSTWVV